MKNLFLPGVFVLIISVWGASVEAVCLNGQCTNTETYVGGSDPNRMHTGNQPLSKKDLKEMAGGVSGGANASAEDSSASQAISSGKNMAVGTVTFVMGWEKFHSCPEWTCKVIGGGLMAIGTMEIGMSTTQMVTSKGSDKTADSVAFRSSAGNAYQVEMPDGSIASESDLAKKASDVLAKAKALGINASNGKVTLPNGNTLDASALSSPGALANATGLTEDQARLALGEINSKSKQYADLSKYKLSFTGGGGAGGAGGGGSVSSGDPSFNLQGMFGQRKPAQAKVAGLEKVVGGSTVGVATDNIFQMVQRRYTEKKKESFFAP